MSRDVRFIVVVIDASISRYLRDRSLLYDLSRKV